jgi:hypothetical protein
MKFTSNKEFFTVAPYREAEKLWQKAYRPRHFIIIIGFGWVRVYVLAFVVTLNRKTQNKR